MKILLIHSDFIEFEARQKAIKAAEDWNEPKKRMEECLVVFTAVEKRDEPELKKATEMLVKEIIDVAEKVKTKNIVLYPYAHLSSSLSSPRSAQDVLEEAEKLLKNDFNVIHAPFGWYKAFNIKAKGHPLSELSREIDITKSTGAEEEKKKEIKRKRVKGETLVSPLPKELSENDHRHLGKLLDLYSFQEYAPGMVFFHPKGLVIRNQLIDFWREVHKKEGYREINTPILMNKSVWEMSGHWEHYRDFMFLTKIEDNDFGIKPMNCAGAILVFKSGTRSYKELPLKLCEMGQVHRNELSGVLSGLFRVRYFTQDDAHIFVTEDQIEDEVQKVVKMVDHFYKIFGFKYHVELSTRPDKFMGSAELWDKGEKYLAEALKKKGIKYKVNKGDGAFYGPKIDFHLEDSLGRSWQCATIQVDFQMPKRFSATYMGEDNKPHTPVIIHRVIYGAIERFIGILVEHYKGAFPVWLSPIQVRVISFTDKNEKKAKEVMNELTEAGIRTDSDFRSATVEYKVRDAEVQKINYIIVIGDKEEKSNTIAVRKRGTSKVEYGVKMSDFLKQIKKEIEEKK